MTTHTCQYYNIIDITSIMFEYLTRYLPSTTIKPKKCEHLLFKIEVERYVHLRRCSVVSDDLTANKDDKFL